MEMTEAIMLTDRYGGHSAADRGLGELVVERSGVLNLGVEGMMIMGAVSGLRHRAVDRFGLGSDALAAMVAGMLFSLLFGILTLTLVRQSGGDRPVADHPRARDLRA
jgi:hypothetical protein